MSDPGVPATLTLADSRSQVRLRKLAYRALYSQRAAIKLFCLECMGYSHADAKACQTPRCPLWAMSNRIFHRSSIHDPAGTAAAQHESTP